MRQLIDLVGAGFTAGYGLTEAASCSTGRPPEHVIAKGVRRRAIPPQSRVNFDEHDRDVPVGELREIIQGGPTVTRGYWRRREPTAEALRGG